MKKTNASTLVVPTAYIAVNKSRVKIYDKENNPKIYLSKQTEFQIELFNPTSEVILAKISLNGKTISQGGLILNPGQRVFLDRYLDTPQKFLFDTYEVSDTSEVKKAIEDNGDIRVQFYKETKYFTKPFINRPTWISEPYSTFTYGSNTAYFGSFNVGSSQNYLGELSLDNDFKSIENPIKISKSKIETGRVEKGSHSNQEFKYVSKDFECLPFHTVEYKLLPISQKINTLDDINIKRYCTNCGHKLGKTDKFCGQCGKKI